MICKYVKKPITIEAVQWDGTNLEEIKQFAGGSIDVVDCDLIITTLEGPLHASVNDWIIKGIKGEFYPCKPDIFDSSYMKVE